METENKAMYDALIKLIEAKNYKIDHGKDSTYKALALDAWKTASEAIYLVDIGIKKRGGNVD